MLSQEFYKEREFKFTSESVSHGHPDKVCDQISDAILDEYLKQNPYSRVALESLVTKNKVVLAGEVRGTDSVVKQMDEIVRKTIKNIGYDQIGFSYRNVIIENLVHGQSADIAMGVDSIKKEEEGAGDQGLMFGYATNETDALMPAPIYYSHLILHNIFEAQKNGRLKDLGVLGPDAKSQVTLNYKGNKPISADSIVLSIQHEEGISKKQIEEAVYPYIKNTLPNGWMCAEEKLYVNPTGNFVIGGPVSDTGLTGRKIIVDTYGGAAPHGGGAFSGKDPTKVDRSAAYVARYLAKNVVASGIAEECTIQLAYAIGVAKPLALYVNTHGTGLVDENKISNVMQELVDLTPWGLRQHLKLHNPIYKNTASYGHFGRKPTANGEFTWEKIDIAEKLKKLV